MWANATDVDLMGRPGEDRAGQRRCAAAPVPQADEGRRGGHCVHGRRAPGQPGGDDLATRKLRRTLRAFGNVPMVHTRVLDAFDMVRRGACKARIVLKGHTEEWTSHNVIATVLGTERPEEIISFGAHYDSVDFSKGVYDNGAGSVINMEVLRYFKRIPPSAP